MKPKNSRSLFWVGITTVSLFLGGWSEAQEPSYSVRQITKGPQHYFFGYTGHVGTIPWNDSGRYIVSLRTTFIDHLPSATEPAEVVLIDTEHDNAITVLDRTLAWNPQQGTMLYWNPAAAETQFFFNDRDPESNQVFTVLFDISRGEHGERIQEYRFSDASIANSGVAQHGEFFLALNYGRLARLRPVTGYRDANDWTKGVIAPKDDGIHKVNIASGKKELLVSYAQIQDRLAATIEQVDQVPLFINHSLCSRDSKHIYFFARGNWRGRRKSDLPFVDAPFTMNTDGTDLQLQNHIGGHPEWSEGNTIIGATKGNQVLYDVEARKIIGKIGNKTLFPNPWSDIALSPDGNLFVNGHGKKVPPINTYRVLNLETQQFVLIEDLSREGFAKGELRIDPNPCWNRDGTKLLVSGIAKDGTRQQFVIDLFGL